MPYDYAVAALLISTGIGILCREFGKFKPIIPTWKAVNNAVNKSIAEEDKL